MGHFLLIFLNLRYKILKSLLISSTGLFIYLSSAFLVIRVVANPPAQPTCPPIYLPLICSATPWFP